VAPLYYFAARIFRNKSEAVPLQASTLAADMV